MNRPLLLILFTVFLDVVGLGVVIPVAPFYAASVGRRATVRLETREQVALG